MPTPRRLICVALLSYALSGPTVAAAHEYWIEPLFHRVAAGEAIVANLRLGEQFKGDLYPFIPQKSLGTWLVDGDGARPWGSRIGDIPAFRETPARPGLHVLAYYSTASRLHYGDPGKFRSFLENEGLAWVLEEHRQRGFAEIGFDEAFSRCAKALVQVGDGSAGSDAAIGLPLELIANANPYALEAGAPVLPVTLLWQGAPLADAQITVFRDLDGVAETKVRTTPDGTADIPLGPGGKFLLNAVHMIPWDERPLDAWHSYWASLTFEFTPARETP